MREEKVKVGNILRQFNEHVETDVSDVHMSGESESRENLRLLNVHLKADI